MWNKRIHNINVSFIQSNSFEVKYMLILGKLRNGVMVTYALQSSEFVLFECMTQIDRTFHRYTCNNETTQWSKVVLGEKTTAGGLALVIQC